MPTGSPALGRPKECVICAPHGNFTATPEAAPDRDCGLYLNDVTAWIGAKDENKQNSRENF